MKITTGRGYDILELGCKSNTPQSRCDSSPTLVEQLFVEYPSVALRQLPYISGAAIC